MQENNQEMKNESLDPEQEFEKPKNSMKIDADGTGETIEKVEAETQEQAEDPDLLFQLRYRIPQDDYYNFQWIMTEKSIVKTSRLTKGMGITVLLIAVVYFFLMITGKVIGGSLGYIILALIILLGGYLFAYHRTFYQKSLRKSIRRQYAHTPYLQNDIIIDFYEDRCEEYFGDTLIRNYWKDMTEFKISDELVIIMLNKNRCILIPKAQIPEQLAQLESLIDQVSTGYEKPKVKVEVSV